MKPIIETGPDVLTIIAEPTESGGALVFATRKEWGRLADDKLEYLQNTNVIKVFKSQTGVLFMLLHDNNPLNYFSEEGRNYNILVKVLADPNGKQNLFCMSISAAEASQIRRSNLTVWE